MDGKKCSSKTAIGGDCRNNAEPNSTGLCWAHGGLTVDEAAKRRSEISKLGHDQRWGAARAASAAGAPTPASATSTRLRSTSDLQAELELQLTAVKASGGDANTKATAATKIITEARNVLAAERLERENAELKKLLYERYPDLRSVKSV